MNQEVSNFEKLLKFLIILILHLTLVSTTVEDDDRLFLTPLLLAGKSEEAKRLSRVNLCEDCEVAGIESYSGFLTVNSTFNKNLFFYFVPARVPDRKGAPLMLWLNGGPGSTSMLALFVEHGPFYVDTRGKNLKLRNVTWTSTMSIIYVDNPVGAGFSFTDNEEGFPRTTEEAVSELYIGLVQFLKICSEYQTSDFYVAGQSYAGKYGPALAHKIHESNQNNPEITINLKGIAIGSGFFDPVNQLNYASFYYNTGLIDESQLTYFEGQEELTRKLIDAKNWTEAFVVLESLIIGYPTPTGTSHFDKVTGLQYNLNILLDKEPEENFRYEEFLSQTHIRQALHVGDTTFISFNPKVYNRMKEDIYQSIRPQFIDLLNADYNILIYSSQFDGVVPYITISEFVNSLSNSNWKLGKDYAKAERRIWRENGKVAGYVKSVGKFTFVLIRDCGHLAAYDQPEWTFDMINRFTHGLPI